MDTKYYVGGIITYKFPASGNTCSICTTLKGRATRRLFGNYLGDLVLSIRGYLRTVTSQNPA